MTLAELKPGQQLIVGAIGDCSMRLQALRFGLSTGSCLTCVERIWGGPIVIEIGRQQIAIGAKLAQHITGELREVLEWEGKTIVVS